MKRSHFAYPPLLAVVSLIVISLLSPAASRTSSNETAIESAAGPLEASVVVPPLTCAGTKNWIAGDGFWQDAANWSVGTLPGPSDDVCIPAGVSVTLSSGTHSINSLGSNGALIFSSGSLTIAGSFNSDGAVSISGGTLSVGTASSINNSLTLSSGTLTGSGSLDVFGLLNWSGGQMSGAGITNANGGMTINPSSGVFLITRTLNNNGSATLSSTGDILMGGVLNNAAGSTFDVQTDHGFIFFGDPGTINNAGLFKKSAGAGTTNIHGACQFNNIGTVEVMTGTLAFLGGGTSSGPFNASGNSLQFNGTHTLSATANVTAANVSFTGGSTTIAGTYNVSNSTTASSGTVNFNGTITNLGTTLTASGGTANANSNPSTPPTTLTVSGGTANFDFTGSITIGTVNFSGGILSGTATINISGMLSWSGGQMSGAGITNANGGMTINPSSGVFLITRTLNNNGSATLSSTGDILMGGVLNNAVGSTFDVQTDHGFVFFGDPGTINNAGLFKKSAGASTTNIHGACQFNNTGTVQAQSGTVSFNGGGYTQTAGSTTLNGGNISTSTPLSIQGGILSGSGTITGNVSSSGSVRPGSSPGAINITGNYTQTSAGALFVEIGGLTAGTQFDQVNITGTATLNGTLNIQLINGFLPNQGDAFQIMSYGSNSGTFATINGLMIGSGRLFQANYNLTNLTLNTVSDPTEVTLMAFTATGYDGGVFLEWKTGFEVDNLGFNIYRDEAGERTLVTAQLVAGSALKVSSTLGAGASYAWWDKTVNSSVAYWLEDLDLKGESTWHGPFYTKHVEGAPPAQSRAALLSNLGGNQLQDDTTLPVETTAPYPAVSSAASFAASPQLGKPLFSLASQLAAKIALKHEGWYRVTQPELAAIGFKTKVDPRLLQLFVDGRELPILVQGEQDGSFDPSDSIEFYGVGLDSAFSDSRVYWLAAGNQPGLRISKSRTEAAPSDSSSFTQTVERRDRTLYFSALRNGERENFFGAVIARDSVEQSLSLTHIATFDLREATLEVVLQGVTLIPHRVSAELNGAGVGVLKFDGQSQGVARFTVPHSLLREGQNIVRLRALGGPIDVSLVDFIRISYQRSYTADNSLKLSAAGLQQITVDGFGSDSIRVIDVTDADSPQEIIGAVEKRKAGYAISFAATEGGERSLLAFTTEQRPESLAMNRPSNLRTGRADFIIITRREFAESLKPLVALRQSQGLIVALVDIEDVYDEFSFGQKTPFAVRAFLAYAKWNWKKKPGFVLFAGDASLDPKNYLGFGDSDLVPSKLIDTDLMETASDDWLADFDDDGVSDLAIGRLPVRTDEEASLLVSKIIAYESSSPAQEVLLVADANGGFDFEAANNQLASLVPPSLKVTQVNRGRVGTETAKKKLLEGIYRGQKLVNYTGHGSINLWRAELLDNTAARTLVNNPLPVFVMMTCLNGYFHDAALDSLAESLMKAEQGGAVAVWASSGMTDPGSQALMNQHLYRLLLGANRRQSLTLGEATQRAKAATADAEVRRTWILFGDPTMKLR